MAAYERVCVCNRELDKNNSSNGYYSARGTSVNANAKCFWYRRFFFLSFLYWRCFVITVIAIAIPNVLFIYRFTSPSDRGCM